MSLSSSYKGPWGAILESSLGGMGLVGTWRQVGTSACSPPSP